MKKSILFLFFVSITYLISAQTQRIKVNADDKLVNADAAVGSPIMTAEFIGFRNPPSVDLNWQPFVTEFMSDNSSEDDAVLEKIKEEKNKLKWSSAGKVVSPNQGNQIQSALVPTMGTNFIGISNGGGNTPLDNTLAISNGGIIVVAVNTKIEYRDTTGKTLYSQTLKTLIADNSLPVLCDPKVIYDSGDDRFIFFSQTCDGGATASKLIIGFSKTNNPSGGWYFFQITGNPLNDGSWFDYPKMAVNNNELFITGNLFKTSGTFNQSVIYEIDKKGGYAGTTNLTWKYWSAIAGPPFTILPAGNGQQGNYGPGIYFVSTAGNTTGSTNINLYELTDDMTNTSAQLKRFAVTTTQYKVGGNSAQSGSTLTLATGDCRALDGFYLDGIVHFVFQTDVGSGWLGISYNRVNVSTATNVSSMHGGSASSIDYAYPSIASLGTTPTDKSVLIAYNRSGSSIFPETAVVACDDLMSWSPDLLVRKGDNYVDYSWTSTNPERWGDYNGIWRRQSSTSIPTVWMAGMYGTTGKIWGQWIAEINSNQDVTGVQNNMVETNHVAVYPNPVTDIYSVDFVLDQNETLVVSILDLQGRVVKELFNGAASKGRNLFTFNKAQLTSGMYFVNIRTGSNNNVKNEKIIISGN